MGLSHYSLIGELGSSIHLTFKQIFSKLSHSNIKIIERYNYASSAIIFGSESFKKTILNSLNKKKITASSADYRRSKLTFSSDKIIKACCDFFKLEESDIYKSRRGMTNQVRKIAIYCCRTLASKSLAEISSKFNFSTHSNVSNIVSEIKIRLKTDRKFELSFTQLQKAIWQIKCQMNT